MAREVWVVEFRSGNGWSFYESADDKSGAESACEELRMMWGTTEFRPVRYVPEDEK